MRLITATLLLTACGGPGPPPAPQAPTPHSNAGRFEDRVASTQRETFQFPTGGAEASPRGDGRRPVARLEVVLPEADPFVLHATLPVPADIWPRIDGRCPLAVALPDGEAHPAQLKTLTRSVSGKAQVVSLRASLPRPKGRRPGDRVLVDLVQGSFDLPPGPPVLPEGTADLLDPRGSLPVLMRTRDVHGNLYVADLRGDPHTPGAGSRVVLEDGPVQRVVRTYATLVPVELSGEGPARPHLMGVHAYWTVRAGQARVGLALRVNNGATSGSRLPAPEEQPLGVVHWDAIELVLPISWDADPLVQDPFLGETYEQSGTRVIPLVRPYEDGALHMMPPQAQFHRRMTLRPARERRGAHYLLEGLAFGRAGTDLWSWWNPNTARYFPQHALLPDWAPLRIGAQRGDTALRTRLTRQRDALRRTIRGGEPQDGLIAGEVMGWAHPLGVSVQGMTGGAGISFLEGHQAAAAASAPGVEALLLEHRMNASRQPQAQYDREGNVACFEAWIDAEGRVPFDFRTNGRMVPPPFKLPMHGGPPPDRQVRAVHLAKRRPSYDQGSPHQADGQLTGRDDDLYVWMPHDGQHFARWTHRPMALVWLTGDPLALDDLRLAAETFHLMFHGAEHLHVRWSSGVTLRQFEALAAKHPHHGLPLRRDQAWGIDVMCAAWLLADDTWRARREDWFARVAQLLVDGAMPSGLVQRIQEPKLLGGRYGGAQAFECLFLLHAKRCLLETMLRDAEPEIADELAAVHQRALDFLFWGPAWDCVEVREEAVCGPRWHFATGPPNDLGAAPFSDEARYGPRYLPTDGTSGAVDVTYVWAPLEYGMLLARGDRGPSLDDRYMRRALTCGRAAGRWSPLMEELFSGAQRDGSDISGNWGSLIGRVQSLRSSRTGR